MQYEGIVICTGWFVRLSHVLVGFSDRTHKGPDGVWRQRYHSSRFGQHAKTHKGRANSIEARYHDRCWRKMLIRRMIFQSFDCALDPSLKMNEPLPLFVQQAASAKCIGWVDFHVVARDLVHALHVMSSCWLGRVLSRESRAQAQALIQLRCVHSLMVAMGNADYADSQRQAAITLAVRKFISALYFGKWNHVVFFSISVVHSRSLTNTVARRWATTCTTRSWWEIHLHHCFHSVPLTGVYEL